MRICTLGMQHILYYIIPLHTQGACLWLKRILRVWIWREKIVCMDDNRKWKCTMHTIIYVKCFMSTLESYEFVPAHEWRHDQHKLLAEGGSATNNNLSGMHQMHTNYNSWAQVAVRLMQQPNAHSWACGQQSAILPWGNPFHTHELHATLRYTNMSMNSLTGSAVEVITLPLFLAGRAVSQ